MTLHVYVLPDKAASINLARYDRLRAFLAKATGMIIEIVVPASSEAAVSALCNGQADMAILETPAYLIARDQCGVQAQFSLMRDGQATRAAEVLVQTESVRRERGVRPIRALGDLQNAIVSYVNPLSPTGYLLGKAMLVEANVPVREEVFAGGDVQAVWAVYNGDADAAVVYWQPFARRRHAPETLVRCSPLGPTWPRRCRCCKYRAAFPIVLSSFAKGCRWTRRRARWRAWCPGELGRWRGHAWGGVSSERPDAHRRPSL